MLKHNATAEHMAKWEQIKLKLIMRAQSCVWLFTSILAFRLPFTASLAFTFWLSAVLGLNIATIRSLIVTPLGSST